MAVKTYKEWREFMWNAQPREGVNWHSGTINGTKFEDLDQIMLQPKRNLFFKDIIHCPDIPCAKQTASDIVRFPEIKTLELKGTWVWVQFDISREDWVLPGQDLDGREKVQG